MRPITVVFSVLASLGGAPATLATATPVLAQAEVATETTVLAVENMTCELCPLTVKTAIARVPGVISVVVDFDAKTATVTFDPTTATVEAIAAASTNVGYPARIAGA